MNSMPVEILPIADNDVREAITYIASDNPQAAGKLLDAIQAVIGRLSQYPHSGSAADIHGMRRYHYHKAPVPPYVIYYRIHNETLLIVRVLHERMDAKAYL